MSIRIYVEGGGHTEETRTRCRQRFAEFLKKAISTERQPKVIACRSRNATFDTFKIALDQHQNVFIILLVDSEGPVASGSSPWAHLKTRDGWDQPTGVTDGQAHLMVQCMEAWFLADKDTLADYYGEGFNRNALPGRQDIEQIAKADVEKALENATRNTRTQGQYHKTRHGFELLSRMDPAKVRRASEHANRLCETLETTR